MQRIAATLHVRLARFPGLHFRKILVAYASQIHGLVKSFPETEIFVLTFYGLPGFGYLLKCGFVVEIVGIDFSLNLEGHEDGPSSNPLDL